MARNKRELSPGERKKRKRRILIFSILGAAMLVLLLILLNYYRRYYLQPRQRQRTAYALALSYETAGDAGAAIQAYAHAGEMDALSYSKFNLLPAQGGAESYADADARRLALELSLLSEAQAGDLVWFGTTEQDCDFENGAEAILWRVLARDGERLLLVAEYQLDCIAWNDDPLAEATWAQSSLRAWLNGDFLALTFTAAERFCVSQTTVVTPDNPESGASGGADCRDRLFLLSAEEVLAYFATAQARLSSATDYARLWGAYYSDTAGWWWLRDTGTDLYHAALVHNDGTVYYSGYRQSMVDSVGVRPAFWFEYNTSARPLLP